MVSLAAKSFYCLWEGPILRQSSVMYPLTDVLGLYPIHNDRRLFIDGLKWRHKSHSGRSIFAAVQRSMCSDCKHLDLL